MRSTRFTIAASMGLIALAAVGLAAIHRPTRLAASGISSLALATLFASIVAAIASVGRRRLSWKGFAVCGWGYFILTLGPGFESTTAPYVITTPIIDLFHERFDTRPTKPLGFPPGSYVINIGTTRAREHWDDLEYNAGYALGMRPPSYVQTTPYPLYRIVQSLLSIAAGLAGGLLAWSLSRRASEPARDVAPASNP